MEREAIVWLALFVILLIVELLTEGLTSSAIAKCVRQLLPHRGASARPAAL